MRVKLTPGEFYLTEKINNASHNTLSKVVEKEEHIQLILLGQYYPNTKIRQISKENKNQRPVSIINTQTKVLNNKKLIN